MGIWHKTRLFVLVFFPGGVFGHFWALPKPGFSSTRSVTTSIAHFQFSGGKGKNLEGKFPAGKPTGKRGKLAL